MATYGPKNLRISFTAEGLTHFGGLVLVQRFLQRLGLRRALTAWVWFPQRNHRYSIAEHVLAVLYPLILGLGRIETTEPLRRNGVFQYLAGLPTYPAATTLRRFLHRFGIAGLAAFGRLHDRYRRAFRGTAVPVTQAVLDFDSTVLTVYGQQEQAAIGFNPKKRGRPSYLPLLCFDGVTRDVWAGSFHPGNTHVATVTLALCEEAWAKLPATIRTVRVRADAAFFDHKLIEWLEARGAAYVIVARLTAPIKRRLSTLVYQRISGEIAAAEFQYQPQGWPGPRRFVVIRRPVPEEPSWQLHLFQLGRFHYQAFVTNLPLTPLYLWRFYNDRSQAELIIRQLKEAYALGKIPTKDFPANLAFFHLALFAYNCLNWFKQCCAPPAFQQATLQRLRHQLLWTPALLVRPGGHPTLRLPASYPHQAAFQDTLQRIAAFRPPWRR
jgi:hypothetical protein